MKSGIYKIVNKVNGKVYIGSTTNFGIRKTKHFCDLKANRHDNSRLQRSFNKHGIQSFEFEIIITCPPDKLLQIEQICINSYNPEYNLLPQAYTTYGYKHTEESKQRMRDLRKGTKPSPNASINSAKSTSKRIYQYDLSHNLIREWSSTKEAARNLGYTATNIACCARRLNSGKSCTYMGFLWSYEPI